MRDAFAKTIHEIAQHDARVVLLSGDIGNRMFDAFKSEFPDRFYNCGVAEANMVTLSAGLASCGLLPVCYTIAPFITYRCMEQIRVDLCYQNLPVVLVGTGAGLSYANLGVTHHSLEDVGMLSTLPNMRIVAPCDRKELTTLLKHIYKTPQPTYLRIGKKGEPDLIEQQAVELGEPTVFSSGTDIALFGTGTIMAEVLLAGKQLQQAGRSVEIANIHTLKPLNQTYLQNLMHRCQRIIVVEEHGKTGGLCSAIADVFARSELKGSAPSFKFLSVENAFSFKFTGDQETLRKFHKIDASAIYNAAIET